MKSASAAFSQVDILIKISEQFPSQGVGLQSPPSQHCRKREVKKTHKPEVIELRTDDCTGTSRTMKILMFLLTIVVVTAAPHLHQSPHRILVEIIWSLIYMKNNLLPEVRYIHCFISSADRFKHEHNQVIQCQWPNNYIFPEFSESFWRSDNTQTLHCKWSC